MPKGEQMILQQRRLQVRRARGRASCRRQTGLQLRRLQGTARGREGCRCQTSPPQVTATRVPLIRRWRTASPGVHPGCLASPPPPRRRLLTPAALWRRLGWQTRHVDASPSRPGWSPRARQRRPIAGRSCPPHCNARKQPVSCQPAIYLPET